MLWEFALVTTRAAPFWIFYRRFRKGPTEYYYNSFNIKMMGDTAMAFTDPTFPPRLHGGKEFRSLPGHERLVPGPARSSLRAHPDPVRPVRGPHGPHALEGQCGLQRQPGGLRQRLWQRCDGLLGGAGEPAPHHQQRLCLHPGCTGL